MIGKMVKTTSREIALVSVTYNSEAAVPFFVDKASKFDHIVVVDNASSDRTLLRLSTELSGATLLSNSKNEGFGVANNIGFEAAKKLGFSWVLFANPDCQITYDSACTLRDALVAHANAVIAFPHLSDDGGKMRQVWTWDFAKPYKSKAPAKVSEIDIAEQKTLRNACIDGACFLVNAQLFDSMGAFSPELFLFCEEDDLNLRASLNGYDVLFVPAARGIHLGGKSSASNWKVDLLKAYCVRWSRFFMTNKYIGKRQRIAEVSGVLLMAPLLILLHSVSLNKRRVIRWVGWLLASLDGLFMSKLFRKIF